MKKEDNEKEKEEEGKIGGGTGERARKVKGAQGR